MILFLINLIVVSFSLPKDKTILKESKVLVVYFSCTGNTKRIATNINSIIGGDLIEIVPTNPYTQADLNYGDSSSRVVKEHNDQTILPEISNTINGFEQYKTIFIGYPLWWGQAPNIIRTFVKKYDYTNKDIITFSTSISTSTDSSKNILQPLAPNANWNDSWKRFRSNAPENDVKAWTDTLGMKQSIVVIYFSASGNTKRVAEFIQKATNADIKSINPVQPYTNDDLNWHDESSRVWEEHRNPYLRPEIQDVGNLQDYDVIFLGYPLWWRKAPHVVYTFIESKDFSGKTIIPFCTSTADGIGDSGTDLASKTTNAKWQEGTRFGESPTEQSVIDWVDEIDYSSSKPASDNDKILITYFSGTGNTRRVAQSIRNRLSYGRIEEIKPVNPYTSSDLNYHDSNSRVVREHADSSFRPEFNDINGIDKAETVFVGYPLWWREAPHVVYTFIEKYSFSGKTIIPFCTSTSDGMGDSGKNLGAKITGATVYQGQRFESNANDDDVKKWMDKIVQVDSNNRITFLDKTIKGGLPTGAIIGISVACVVVVAAFVIIIVVVVIRKRRKGTSNLEASQ